MIAFLKTLITKFNQNHFSILYLIFASVLSYLFISNPEGYANLKEIIALSLTKIGILYVSVFLLIKPLYRFDFDILKEVFEKKNTAAGIFLAGIMIAIAIVL